MALVTRNRTESARRGPLRPRSAPRMPPQWITRRLVHSLNHGGEERRNEGFTAIAIFDAAGLFDACCSRPMSPVF